MCKYCKLCIHDHKIDSVHVCVRYTVCMHTYIHTNIHTNIHTCMHAYIHTFITLHYITLHYITYIHTIWWWWLLLYMYIYIHNYNGHCLILLKRITFNDDVSPGCDFRRFGLEECAAYWQQVVDMNDYQKIAFTSSRAATGKADFGAQCIVMGNQ